MEAEWAHVEESGAGSKGSQVSLDTVRGRLARLIRLLPGTFCGQWKGIGLEKTRKYLRILLSLKRRSGGTCYL